MSWKIVSPTLYRLLKTHVKTASLESKSLTLINTESDMILSFDTLEGVETYAASITLDCLDLPKLEQIDTDLYQLKINQFEVILQSKDTFDLINILNRVTDKIVNELSATNIMIGYND